MARRYLGGRLVLDRTTGWLAAGDLVALLAFAAFGEATHGGTLAATVETALQFGVGWLVVALLVGAYGVRALDGLGRGVLLGAGGWALAAVVGAVVRVATEAGAGLSPIFLLVTAGVGAVIFGAWRAIAVVVLSPRTGK